MDANRKNRAIAAAVAGTAVFLLTYLVAWVQLNQLGEADLRIRFNEWELRSAKTEFEAAQVQAKMMNMPNSFVWPDDYWGHPFIYKPIDSGFHVITYGRDGIPGGKGLDADIIFDEKSRLISSERDQQLPLWQFVFDSTSTSPVFFNALFGGCCAAAIGFFCQSRSRGSERIPMLVMTVLVAAMISVFMAVVHAFTQHERH